MPAIWLDRDERRDLPPVCMVCGVEATTTTRQTFRWHPPWVIVLILVSIPIWVIVALILTKTMTVHAPVCEEHRGYWRRRKLIAWLPVLSGVTLFGVGAAVMIGAGNDPRLQDIGLYVMLGGALWFFVTLIAAAIVLRGGVRATEITDDEVRLAGVHPEFVDALRDRRREERDRERARRLERDQEHDDRGDRGRRSRRDEGHGPSDRGRLPRYDGYE
jgi:hypothetical protein